MPFLSHSNGLAADPPPIRPNPSLALRDVRAPLPLKAKANRTLNLLSALKRVRDDENAAQGIVDTIDILLTSGAFTYRRGHLAPGRAEAETARRAAAFVAPLVPIRLPMVCPIVAAQGMEAMGRLLEHCWFWGEWADTHPDERFEIVGRLTVLRNAAENVVVSRELAACDRRLRAEAERERAFERKHFGAR